MVATLSQNTVRGDWSQICCDSTRQSITVVPSYASAFNCTITIISPVAFTAGSKYHSQARSMFRAYQLFMGWLQHRGGLRLRSGLVCSLTLTAIDDKSDLDTALEMVKLWRWENPFFLGAYSSSICRCLVAIPTSNIVISRQGLRYVRTMYA